MNTHKRDATIALCGLVAGIMVGAATLLSQDDITVALSGSAIPSAGIQIIPRAEALRRTTVKSFMPSPSSSSASSQSSVAAEAPTPLHDCLLAREMAGAFTASVDANLMPNTENRGSIAALKKTAQGFLDKYCPSTLFSSSSSSSTPKIDNGCGRYGKNTDRYATCRAKEQMGFRYE